MSRRNELAKWVLPETVNPPDVLCVTIRVPNERFYKAAFWGALLDLASAYKWQDDSAHTAKDVAQVWRGIIDDLKLDICPIAPAVLHGMEIDFDMGIRVDCDCRVWITCCDGTEKELALVEMLNKSGQPGTGQPQPAPGGGQQCYQFAMAANQQVYLPTGLSTGDVVTIQNAQGAGSNSHDSIWHLLNGDQFFLGQDVGFPVVNGANPVPAAPTGSLIIILNGTAYAIGTGSFTVPSGYANAEAVFQVNDNTLAGLAGDFSFQACVTNNSVAQFTHHFDFRLSPYGFVYEVVANSDATWTPGIGFTVTNTTGLLGAGSLGISLQPPAALSNVTLRMLGTSNNGVGAALYSFNVGSVWGTPIESYSIAPVTPIDFSHAFTNPVPVIAASNTQNSPAGNGVISDMFVSADGVDPF